jgi:predicted nucleic acid-binding protein
MTKYYFDSSAIAKFFLDEPGKDEIQQFANRVLDSGDIISTTVLAHTEVRRTAKKLGFSVEAAELALGEFEISSLTVDDYIKAGVIGPDGEKLFVRSLDALHIVAAKKANADFAITFDIRQAAGFKEQGIDLFSIGGSHK